MPAFSVAGVVTTLLPAMPRRCQRTRRRNKVKRYAAIPFWTLLAGGVGCLNYARLEIDHQFV